MHNLFFIFFFSLCLFLGIGTNIQAQSLSLDSCFYLLDKQRKSLEVDQLNSQLRKARLSQLWKAYLPQLGMEAQATYQSDVPELLINLPQLELPKIPKDQYAVSLNVQQLIWDGGKLKAAASKIKTASRLEHLEFQQESLGEKERLIDLYFGIILLDKNIELLRLTEDKLDKEYERISILKKNGLAAGNDLDLILLEQHKLKRSSIDLRSQRTTLSLMLCLLCGLEPVGSLKLKAAEIIPDFLTEDAPIRRPELDLLEVQKTLLLSEWEDFKTKLMPQLAIFGRLGYGKPGLNLFDPKPRDFYLLGVKLTWNFGDLYRYAAKKRERDFSLQQLSLKKDRVQTQLKLKDMEVYAKTIRYREMSLEDEKIIALRKKMLQRARLQHKEGSISTTDLLEKIRAYEQSILQKEIHKNNTAKAYYKHCMNIGAKMLPNR